MKLNSNVPVVLLLKDGSAGVLTGVNAERNVVFIRDPRLSQNDPSVPVDELRLSQVWTGEALLVRRQRGIADEDKPFDAAWIGRMVLHERSLLRDVGLASIALSVLAILPPLLVMTVIDRVIVHQSSSTLVLITVVLVIACLYETMLGWSRRELIQVVSTRLDAKLNLHLFNKLLNLPLDYFERNQAGQITYRLFSAHKVRDFVTGKLLSTFLDMFTLVVLLPVLFYLNSTLTWFVLGGSFCIALIIFSFMPAMRRTIGRVVAAETQKNVVLVETVHGIKTVKSLALDPLQKDAWDQKVSVAARYRLEAGRLSNWPQHADHAVRDVRPAWRDPGRRRYRADLRRQLRRRRIGGLHDAGRPRGGPADRSRAHHGRHGGSAHRDQRSRHCGEQPA